MEFHTLFEMEQMTRALWSTYSNHGDLCSFMYTSGVVLQCPQEEGKIFSLYMYQETCFSHANMRYCLACILEKLAGNRARKFRVQYLNGNCVGIML